MRWQLRRRVWRRVRALLIARKVGRARVAIGEQLHQVDFTVAVDVRRRLRRRPRAAAGQVDDREGADANVPLGSLLGVGVGRDRARVRAARREGGAVAEQPSTGTVKIHGVFHGVFHDVFHGVVANHFKQLLEIFRGAHRVDTAALAYRAPAGASARRARPQSAWKEFAFQFLSCMLERFHLWEWSHSVDGNDLRCTHPAEMIRLLLAIEFFGCRRNPLILGNLHPTK